MSDFTLYKKQIISQHPKKTKEIGEKLGKQVTPGSIICIYGDLGSGKTVFAKGVSIGCGVNENEVKSPSFALINCYDGKFTIYHIDLYRIDDPVYEMEQMGYRDFFYSDNCITIIEWADKITPLLPDSRIDITLTCTGDHTRDILISSPGCSGIQFPV